MQIFSFETVDSLPALYHPQLDLLVVSDIHLGLEGTMTADGNYVPKFQLDELLEDLQEAQKLTEASRILINGDLKNEFSTSRFTERNEIKEFLDFIQQNFEETIIIKGNHDTFVESTANEYNLDLKRYHLEDGVLFTHGHISVEQLELDKEFETIVIGHEHPSLALKDDIGIKEKIPCFLHGELDSGENIVVLPAFAKVSRGNDVNHTPQHELLTPALRNRVNFGDLKALGVSREGGLFEFPEIRKL
jgi:putative SbcD/Mre11-related phosphoesterase